MKDIKTLFLQYLSSIGMSKKSIKNYKSDVSHFAGWLNLKLKGIGVIAESLDEFIPFLGNKTAREYFDYLSENNIPIKTVNRRLSSLRKLSLFLVKSQVLDSDFMNEIKNIPQARIEVDLVEKYKQTLIAQNVSESTVKNYISDVRQFLTWVQK